MFLVSRLRDWFGAIHRVRRAYRHVHGSNVRLLQPRTFSEKMQWRKLFDLDPRYAILSDKLAVRDFAARRVAPELLIPVLWSGDDPDAVPFDSLDTPYVIKSTHACEHVLIVRRREELDIADARETFRNWLAYDHGTVRDEPGYVPVPRGLIVERMLTCADGSLPIERRLYVFDGVVRIVQTLFGVAGYPRHGAFHDRDWQRLNWYLISAPDPGRFPRPKCYEQLVAAAECLGEGFDHVRVDFYETDDQIWVGELSLYTFSGLFRFNPTEADEILGSFWNLQEPARRALKSIVRQRREILRTSAIGQKVATM